MNMRTVRKIHRYLGLFVGVQLLLWTAGGLFFSLNSIEKVVLQPQLDREGARGDRGVRTAASPVHEPTGIARARPRGARRHAAWDRGSFRDPPAAFRRWGL